MSRRPFNGTIKLGDVAPELARARRAAQGAPPDPAGQARTAGGPAGTGGATRSGASTAGSGGACSSKPEPVTFRPLEGGRVELLGVWPPRALLATVLLETADACHLEVLVRARVDQVAQDGQPLAVWYRAEPRAPEAGPGYVVLERIEGPPA